MKAETNSNDRIAEFLHEMGTLLSAQHANPYRVSAYQHAAETLRRLDYPITERFDKEGIQGLKRIPTIGEGIARAIIEIIATGRWVRLDRLKGESDPITVLQLVPGVGPKTAHLLHDKLHLETLEGLEAALHDNRIAKVPGMGPRRVAALRTAVRDVLGHSATANYRPSNVEPAVALVLDVDREYRDGVLAKRLPLIAPKRFNPDHVAWLPILHTQRDDWHFTALFSNTARAHDLGRNTDWVVMYYYDTNRHEHQCTVVTEHRTKLFGKRVIRGREPECGRHYRELERLKAAASNSGNGAP